MAPGMIVGIDVETANTDGAICEFGAVAIDAVTGAEVFRVGGAPADSVSRFTSLVVVAGVGEPLLEHHLTTAKAKDALKFGIPVISEPEFLRLIGIDLRSNA